MSVLYKDTHFLPPPTSLHTTESPEGKSLREGHVGADKIFILQKSPTQGQLWDLQTANQAKKQPQKVRVPRLPHILASCLALEFLSVKFSGFLLLLVEPVFQNLKLHPSLCEYVQGGSIVPNCDSFQRSNKYPCFNLKHPTQKTFQWICFCRICFRRMFFPCFNKCQDLSRL